MSTQGGTRAIVAALLANLGIAATKFVAWGFSGAVSMLAEGVHSLADSGNQILLLVGGKRAARSATATHPFGYGRERYFYAFIVSIILFTIGGVFSIYEGIDKLQHPHPLELWWLPMIVLTVSIVLEAFSLRTAVKESNPIRGNASWVQFIRRAKAPELPVVLLEDLAALLGLVFAFVGIGLTALTGLGVFDAVGTLLIGALLIAVAVILGIETKSLLVGEGARPEDVDTISRVITSSPHVTALIHMKTLYLGPDEMLVAAKVGFGATAKLADVAAAIDALEADIRANVPVARVIYIEPDVVRKTKNSTPSTESIVVRGLD
ncbi:MAG: cation diffusion facilitator family transporter [Microbacteriaceae bacterium]|nr:cation diffusion facilitator family transporter [Microbacteriaceae bacterium]